MNDKQFNIGIKISIGIALVILIAIGVIAFMTLKSSKTSSSVLEEVPGAKNVVIENEKDGV